MKSTAVSVVTILSILHISQAATIYQCKWYVYDLYKEKGSCMEVDVDPYAMCPCANNAVEAYWYRFKTSSVQTHFVTAVGVTVFTGIFCPPFAALGIGLAPCVLGVLSQIYDFFPLYVVLWVVMTFTLRQR